MEQGELKAIVENILLAADEPLTVGRLAEIFPNGVGKPRLQAVLEELKEDYSGQNLQIREVAGGYSLCTRMEYSEWVKKYFRLDKSAKLSQPALDTLSIIAYKQPITRAEIEEIRGVDSSGVVKTLLEKNLVGSAGRKKVVGHPMMYRTSQKFLEYFGLKDLSDLPTLEDFKEGEIAGDHADGSPMQTRFLFDEAPRGESPDEAAVEGESSAFQPAAGESVPNADSSGEEENGKA